MLQILFYRMRAGEITKSQYTRNKKAILNNRHALKKQGVQKKKRSMTCAFNRGTGRCKKGASGRKSMCMLGAKNRCRARFVRGKKQKTVDYNSRMINAKVVGM